MLGGEVVDVGAVAKRAEAVFVRVAAHGADEGIAERAGALDV